MAATESSAPARRDLGRARTIVVKVGMEIVESADGLLALGQIGALIEQVASLHMLGHRVVLVSSGSIPIGRMVLRRQHLLSGSMQAHLGGRAGGQAPFFEKAMAAAGQSGLQALYEMLFSQYHLACSQILASDADFRRPRVRANLRRTVTTLLGVGIIPIINENDVITARRSPLAVGDKVAWDNDSLASLFAREVGADLLVILTDVPGIFRAATHVTGAHAADADGQRARELLREFRPGDAQHVVVATESRVGPIGQKDKLHACLRVVDSGAVRAAVIAKAEPGALLRIVRGESVGTLFSARRDGQRLGPGDEYIDPLYSDISPPGDGEYDDYDDFDGDDSRFNSRSRL